MENHYQLTLEGEAFIQNPQRNHNGHIRTDFFRTLILIYLFVKNEKYSPREFKMYVESLNILKDEDYQLMGTRDYEIWKHHIDAAKQSLRSLLSQNLDSTFSLKENISDNALKEIIDFVHIVDQPKFEYPDENVGASNRVTTTISRTVRDTVLSNHVKEERNFICQVCGESLIINDKGYAEAHHVFPLGHNGPDIEENLLVLCPNHHVLFDYGGIAILPEDMISVIDSSGKKIFTLSPPKVKKDFIEYHFNKIFRKNFKN